MRLVLAVPLVGLLAAACGAADSGGGLSITTPVRTEAIDVPVATQSGVIPRESTTGTTVLRVAQRSSTTFVTTTTSTTTMVTTTTTLPETPLIPFPAVPPLTSFEAAESEAINVVSDPYTIDPRGCEGIVWTVGGVDWSAFVVTSATGDRQCEVWLGGQTGNPASTERPYLYCLLPEEHEPVTVASDAQFDWVAEPGLCAPTGFDVS